MYLATIVKKSSVLTQLRYNSRNKLTIRWTYGAQCPQPEIIKVVYYINITSAYLGFFKKTLFKNIIVSFKNTSYIQVVLVVELEHQRKYSRKDFKISVRLSQKKLVLAYNHS